VSILTLVNAKTPQMRSHKWRRMFVEVRPNSHMLPSRTEPNIRPNSSAELCVCRTSAHL